MYRLWIQAPERVVAMVVDADIPRTSDRRYRWFRSVPNNTRVAAMKIPIRRKRRKHKIPQIITQFDGV